MKPRSNDARMCLAMLLMLAACSRHPSTRVDAGSGGDGGGACENPLLAELDRSTEAWGSLAADGGGATYWYEELNCAPNSPEGTISVIQVSDGVASKVGERTIPQEDCEFQVNRYESFTAKTFEELYAECRALLERDCRAIFGDDDRDLLRGCYGEGPDNCFDNCGEGFYILRWALGMAPAAEHGDASTE